jgi:lipopolysaccharide/colanic/teichoic acid biosynthesis glycosyltransferase
MHTRTAFQHQSLNIDTSEVPPVVVRAEVGGKLPDPLPVWKRGLDLFGILLLLPVALPLMACLWLFIRCVSPGPAIFRQERMGYRGRSFTCLKFRTMKINAEVDTHLFHVRDLIASNKPMLKIDANDPRVIRFGNILRSSGLDELPQLVNVLRGEMSLVGPRPCTRYEFDQYTPAQKRRFNAAPGLTGLWQVNGKNRTTFSEMVELDIAYTEEKSLWLDVKILTKTAGVVLDQVNQLRANRRQQS